MDVFKGKGIEEYAADIVRRFRPGQGLEKQTGIIARWVIRFSIGDFKGGDLRFAHEPSLVNFC